jgi:hypothetical protein
VLRDNEVDVEEVRLSSDHSPAALSIQRRNWLFVRCGNFWPLPSQRCRLALGGRDLGGARRLTSLKSWKEILLFISNTESLNIAASRIAVNGFEQEVVVLEFANEGRLYVPLEQAFLVSRLSASEDGFRISRAW